MLVIAITAKANMVTITAGSNILKEYQTDEGCKATLKALQIQSPCSEVRKIIKAFNRDPIMVAVIYQESHFNKYAVNYNKNGTKDSGYFQLNSQYFTVNGDLDHSIAIAKSLKITNWVGFTSGAYKQYLDEAELLIKNV